MLAAFVFPGAYVPRTYALRFAASDSGTPPRLIFLSLQIVMIIAMFALVVRVSVRQRPAQLGRTYSKSFAAETGR